MQFSVGVEYGLHCLLYLVGRPAGETLGIKELAKFQGISESYLSKVFTKLRKAGIVRSTPGVKGGYELAMNPKDITFWQVIEAIEGKSYFFQCTGILRNIPLLTEEEQESMKDDCPCHIKYVMHDAEEVMRDYLRGKTLWWLHEEVGKVTTDEYKSGIVDWFAQARK